MIGQNDLNAFIYMSLITNMLKIKKKLQFSALLDHVVRPFKRIQPQDGLQFSGRTLLASLEKATSLHSCTAASIIAWYCYHCCLKMSLLFIILERLVLTLAIVSNGFMFPCRYSSSWLGSQALWESYIQVDSSSPCWTSCSGSCLPYLDVLLCCRSHKRYKFGPGWPSADLQGWHLGCRWQAGISGESGVGRLAGKN